MAERGDYRGASAWVCEMRLRRGTAVVRAAMLAGPPWAAMRKLAARAEREGTHPTLRPLVLEVFSCLLVTPSRGNQPSEATKARVVLRDGLRCVRCGGTERLHVDHLFPRLLGGCHLEWNLATLCAPCNLAKGHELHGWALLRMINQGEAYEATHHQQDT